MRSPRLTRVSEGNPRRRLLVRSKGGAVVEVVFDSHADLQAALTSEAGRQAGQTLIQFAGSDSITLFTEVLEESYS